MDDVLYPTFAVISWIAVGFKVAALRRDPTSPAQRAMVASFAALAVSFTFSTPPVYLAFDRLVGVPNLARLCAHSSVMALSISAQGWLLYWAHPDQIRARVLRRTAVFIAVVAAMTVLFFLAPVDEETLDFSSRYGDAPFVAEYMVIFLGYFGATLADTGRLSWQYSKLAGERWLRLGLRLSVVGAALGGAYCIEKGGYVLLRRLGVTPFPDVVQESFGPVLGGLGGIVLLTGITIPAWGRRVEELFTSLRRYRSYHRLRPLWTALYRAQPEIALEEPPALHRDLRMRDLDYRLLRRVVEIRDARLALRPYLDAAAASAARAVGERAGLAERRLAALVEATVLAHAIRAKRREAPAGEPYTAAATGGDDLAGETAWLVGVAKMFASALAAEAVRDAEAAAEPVRDAT